MPKTNCSIGKNYTQMMNYEDSRANIACPPTQVNQWVEQQLAAIKAEANQTDNLQEKAGN